MIGFFPQIEEGELLYSAVARAAAIVYPGRRTPVLAKMMLGNKNYSFGGIIPNHCDLLVKHLPEISGLTEEKILNGSAYHIIAPILDEPQRSKLIKSIFGDTGIGGRNWLSYRAAKTPQLRYCAACARTDESQGRCATWRVLPNIPGVNCCDLHGCFLSITEAHFDDRFLNHPSDRIKSAQVEFFAATKEELAVAADMRWLYEQRSALLPGNAKVAAAIKGILLEIPGFYLGQRILDVRKIKSELLGQMGDAVQRLDPMLFSSTKSLTIETGERILLQRVSLLAQLASCRLPDVFRRAMSGQDLILNKQIGAKFTRTASAKVTLTELVARFPSNSRNQLWRKAPASAAHLLHVDRSEYEKIMPENMTGRYQRMQTDPREELIELIRKHPEANRTQIRKMAQGQAKLLRRIDVRDYERIMPKNKRGQRSQTFWLRRDREFCGRVRTLIGKQGNDPLTVVKILQEAKIKEFTYYRTRRRLPETCAVIHQLIEQQKRAKGIQKQKLMAA